MARLRRLAAEKAETHRRRFLGSEIEAITLRTPAWLAKLGRTAALSENFLPVEVHDRFPANQLVRLSITGLSGEATLQASPAPTSEFESALAIANSADLERFTPA